MTRLRVAELIDFQSEPGGGAVSRTGAPRGGAGAQATGELSGGVTEAFARGLYALTAVKDEYEVARLHLLDEERQAFALAFPGARPVYMLKPPLLARLGLQRKIKLVRSARPAFYVLRARPSRPGDPFDPFGWTAERRAERRFVAEYLSWVAVALEHLTPVNVDAVRAIVDAANDVHGYAHVRQSSIAAPCATLRSASLNVADRRHTRPAAAAPSVGRLTSTTVPVDRHGVGAGLGRTAGGPRSTIAPRGSGRTAAASSSCRSTEKPPGASE